MPKTQIPNRQKSHKRITEWQQTGEEEGHPISVKTKLQDASRTGFRLNGRAMATRPLAKNQA